MRRSLLIVVTGKLGCEYCDNFVVKVIGFQFSRHLSCQVKVFSLYVAIHCMLWQASCVIHCYSLYMVKFTYP